VLVGSAGDGPALLAARRIGRGQALLVNGSGTWRWSLSGHDELTGERGRQLWRRLVRWLAEPVQGEPLRVRPERWLADGGDAVRLIATLQDESFRPVAGAQVGGEVVEASGRAREPRRQPQRGVTPRAARSLPDRIAKSLREVTERRSFAMRERDRSEGSGARSRPACRAERRWRQPDPQLGSATIYNPTK
jgi:hypothetical protein